jgi:hypothetical protein
VFQQWHHICCCWTPSFVPCPCGSSEWRHDERLAPDGDGSPSLPCHINISIRLQKNVFCSSLILPTKEFHPKSAVFVAMIPHLMCCCWILSAVLCRRMHEEMMSNWLLAAHIWRAMSTFQACCWSKCPLPQISPQIAVVLAAMLPHLFLLDSFICFSP